MFDKIYVISLCKDKERRQSIDRRLKAIDMPYQFFDALDGKLIKHIFKKLNNSYFVNSNYLACNLSHISVYNDAIINNYKKILILEDDAIPHKNYNDLIKIIEIPEYDLLYFGWIPLSEDCQYWNYNLINDKFINAHIFNAQNLWSLYAYSITDNLMKKMVELYSEQFPMEIDRYFVNISKEIKSYGISPQLFTHDYALSNNTGVIDRNNFAKYIDSRFGKIEDYEL